MSSVLHRRLHGGAGCNRQYWSGHDLDILARYYGDAVHAYYNEPPAVMREAPTVAPPSSAPSSKSYSFTISTAAVDRMGDTIAVNGWQLAAYRSNPVVLYVHDAGALPIGRATSVGIEAGRLVANMKFAGTRMAQAVREQVDRGELRATSVGFRPLQFSFSKDPARKMGIDFERQELLEFSIVPIPANPEALLVGSPIGKSSKTLERINDLVLEKPTTERERRNRRMNLDLEFIRLRGEAL